jgi:hypothetical protein
VSFRPKTLAPHRATVWNNRLGATVRGGSTLKNQYFGDVNDYKKYGLLRHFASTGGGTLAVCWTLTEDDTRSDGSRTGYLLDPQTWRRLDPAVFDFVRELVVGKRVRSVLAMDRSDVIPGGRFFGELLTDEQAARDEYFDRFFRFCRGASLVFFDPDNGLGITAVKRGDRRSSKYVYPCEIERAWSSGHSVLFYQHFPRRPRDAFMGRLVESMSHLEGLDTVFFFVTSHVVFVLLPRPEHRVWLAKGAVEFESRWRGVVRVERRTASASRRAKRAVLGWKASTTLSRSHPVGSAC